MIVDKHNFTNKALILTAIGLVVIGGAWYLRPGAKAKVEAVRYYPLMMAALTQLNENS
ncbi:hypothetical protein [Moraxella bovoculi]|uniref:hypothetical protein n=1 Tax=Moraxella bovoculi TaxID=386891 RepID=UPI0012D44BD8|nr:hypothetical protein [Moraxella bovoculi]